jgi:hypothetical protein
MNDLPDEIIRLIAAHVAAAPIRRAQITLGRMMQVQRRWATGLLFRIPLPLALWPRPLPEKLRAYAISLDTLSVMAGIARVTYSS